MKDSKIEWTHHTFNPWWGCTRVSPGCEHCYAETFAKRMGVQWGPRAERRFFGEKHWNEPLKWNREAEKAGERRRVFCASMADVFEDRPELEPERARVFALIEKTPWLDWLLLTKRPENAAGMAPSAWAFGWPENVWPMTTVESQEVAAKRVLHLLGLPASVHGLSVEPLLGPLNLREIEALSPQPPYGPGVWLDALMGHLIGPDDILPRRLSWIIVGGESGHGARPMHPVWARSLRDQCQEAGVPFFFKQWGEYVEGEINSRWVGVPNDGTLLVGDRGLDVARMSPVGKVAAGRDLDGRTWDEVPAQGRAATSWLSPVSRPA